MDKNLKNFLATLPKKDSSKKIKRFEVESILFEDKAKNSLASSSRKNPTRNTWVWRGFY